MRYKERPSRRDKALARPDHVLVVRQSRRDGRSYKISSMFMQLAIVVELFLAGQPITAPVRGAKTEI